MAKTRFIDLLKNTLDEIQHENRANPREETADPSLFDFLKDKLRQVDEKTHANVETNDGNPVSIFDFIKAKVEEAQQNTRQNAEKSKTPDSIFDTLRQRIEEQKRQQQSSRYDHRAEESIADLIDEYNLDVRNLSRDILMQVQAKYAEDNKTLDLQYAKYLQQLNNRYRR